MSETGLVHDVSVWSPYAQETHTARCTCTWVGEIRASLTAARVDAKEHRLETAGEDDSNVKAKVVKPRVRKGSIVEAAAEGSSK